MIRKLALLFMVVSLVVLSARGVIGKHRLGGDSGQLVYKATRMVVEDDRAAVPVAPLPLSTLSPGPQPQPMRPPVPPRLPAIPWVQLTHAPPRASPVA